MQKRHSETNGSGFEFKFLYMQKVAFLTYANYLATFLKIELAITFDFRYEISIFRIRWKDIFK